MTLRYKGYRHDAQQKTMHWKPKRLPPVFPTVLPEGFQRIRYYGFL